jgi:hypothetical protein
MKNKALLIALVALVVVLLGWFFLSGTPASAPEGEPVPDGPVPFTVLDDGANAAAVSEGKNFVIQNEEELALLWSMIYGADAPPMPAVDFATEEVLAVFAGQKESGGYDISVKDIVQENGTRVVTILHETPGEGCMTTQALTSPFELVRVPVGSQNITHEDETVAVSCS